MREMLAVIPYDPVDDHPYVNAVGSTEVEARVNIDLCEESDKIIDRLLYVPITILMPEPVKNG